MKRFIESFTHAFDGLCYVWKEERNFRIQIIIGIVLIVCMGMAGFSYLETGLIIIAITLVLTAETINTAFEDTLDKIEPNQNAVIGRIKDIAAGVVVLCVFGAVVIGGMVFFSHYSF
jgi:diacylglycerol kinase